MAYSPLKTAKKAAVPLIIAILVRAALAVLEQQGIKIEESTVWEIAAAGYASLIAFINWIKNHKKIDDK